MTALIDVVGPEWRIDEVHILNGHILTVGDVGQTGTLGILVGTLRIPLSANPKLLPEMQAVAINSSFTADGEAIQSVSIDKGREVLLRLTLNTCLKDRIVHDTVRALQRGTLSNMQVRTLLEEQGTGHERALWNDDHAPTLTGCTVDDCLNLLRLQLAATYQNTIVGDDILTTQCGDIHFLGILEPRIHGATVGPCLNSFLSLWFCHYGNSEKRHQ